MTISRTETIIEETPKTITEVSKIGTDFTFKREIIWGKVIFFIILHLAAIYSFFLIPQVKPYTLIYLICKLHFGIYGTTAAAHRFYSHKSFKAVFGHQVVMMLLQTMIGQNSIYIWARDHRQHHKYSDTDADPHNATRGFFFSHIGWLMSKKHPLVKEKGRTIDMSDLKADPIVMFQYRYYLPLYVTVVTITMLIPILLWNETLKNSFFIIHVLHYTIQLNGTWTINSLAHKYGTKPYDKSIRATENQFTNLFSGGEGYHNFHHIFPRDYRTAELGQKFCMTTKLIEWTAAMGWSYDLHTVSKELVARRMERTGDRNLKKTIKT